MAWQLFHQAKKKLPLQLYVPCKIQVILLQRSSTGAGANCWEKLPPHDKHCGGTLTVGEQSQILWFLTTKTLLLRLH